MMSASYTIPEYPSEDGGRLGRHVAFDDRSRSYRAVAPRTTGATRHHLWTRRIRPFDQGNVGSCTGNAAAGLLATAPYRRTVEKVNELLAVDLYQSATVLDTFDGVYPPDDTGSSVLAAMKATVAAGYATGYRWCFGLGDVLDVLSWVGPVAVGLNWYEGFDRPASDGVARIAGSVRGGHAFELVGLHPALNLVFAVNSWGTGWGHGGRFAFSFDDLARLLAEDGEAATLTR